MNGFGAQISGLALPLCAALLLHATPAQMGALVALQALPFALLTLPAGVLLDRKRKLPIMLFSEIMSGVALGSVALAHWFGVLSMPCLYIVGFMIGTGFVLGGGAEQVFLIQLIGRDRLIDAHAKFATTDSAARLIGPGIAGILVQLLTAPIAVLVTACGYALSVLNLRRITVSEPQPAPSDKHPLHDIRDGLAFVWGHPLLRALAWGAGLWHLLYYGSAALSILFATRELGMTPGALGLAQTLGGLGVLVSSQLIKPLTRRHGPGTTMLVGLASTTLTFMLMPAIPAMLWGSAHASAVAYGVLVFFFDCGVTLFFIPYMAMRQKVTPDAYLGRMISTMRFLTVATAPLGALAAGAIAEHFSIRTGLACIAACSLVLTVTMVAASPVRSVRS
ncbi:MFS transporter [Janthinobacterium fluminis]|uniref:MFS transporter n=1 Tax=Janthinobacterium fluminis TaxID=2987524 RepID=A0ABT5K6T7_9BURK|nr:MFS transporter [Janthinobacterium fluminis]MDC8760712.1 MFS transporter [Janthinobacterium fluminis]